MKRLLVRLAPLALMVPAWIVYDRQFNEVDTTSAWVRHTHDTRRMADRIEMHAGCKPDLDSLRREAREFSESTKDNPSQQDRARAIFKALEPFDAGLISRLAREASAEEAQLLEVRRPKALAQLAEVRTLANRVFLLGVLVGVLGEGIAWLARISSPPKRKGGAA